MVSVACNACEWKGAKVDCVVLGVIGPLCPECNETVCELPVVESVAKPKGLLIRKCSDSLRWYSGLVGQVVEFRGYVGNGEYRSRQLDGYTNFVLCEDAEVVEV